MKVKLNDLIPHILAAFIIMLNITYQIRKKRMQFIFMPVTSIKNDEKNLLVPHIIKTIRYLFSMHSVNKITLVQQQPVSFEQ